MVGILRRLHRWLGLLLAVPLVAQGLSGAMLALQPVLPVFTAEPVTPGAPRSANDVIAAAEMAVPPGLRVARYSPAAAPGGPATVLFVARSGQRGQALGARVDPVSLAVLGEERVDAGLTGWLRALHANLLATDGSGRSVVGWLGVGMLSLAMLGIPLWWPAAGRWRAAFAIDAKAHGARFHRRLHGAIGIWSLALLLVTASTGALLAFPQLVRGALGLPAATAQRTSRQTVRPEGTPADVDRAVALAMGAAQGLRLRTVLLPMSTADPIRLLFAPPDADGVASTVSVAVDATAARIVSVQDGRTLPLMERTLRWAHDLHFGQGFGSLWRALTIITGLLLPIFAVTGCAMWLLRRNPHGPDCAAAARPGGEPIHG